MGENDKLEHDKNTEPQENTTPEVSVDEKKQENAEQNPENNDTKEQQDAKSKEQNETEQATAMSLAELQKKIELIKASDDYTQEAKEQAQKVADELTGQPNANQEELNKKAAIISAIEQKEQGWFQRNKKKIWKWLKKTQFGIGLSVLLHKWGINKWFGDDDEQKETENAKSKEQNESSVSAVETPATEEPETPPQVDADGIDEAVTPPVEKEEEGDKKPEPQMSKVDVNREVNTSMDEFTKTAKEIDSSFSMITKNEETIKADSEKLNAAYKKVMDQLTVLNQNYPEDPEMQELYRTTMVKLAEFYTERGDIDNDHNVDPIKAIQLLVPTVNGIEDATGQKSKLPPMPTQDDLMSSLRESPLGDTIAQKLSEGLTMEQILADENILKKWNDQYKRLFDKWEKNFDAALTLMYSKYKGNKYPGITPMQKKAFELLKDIQGTNDRWDWKDRNVDMAQNIAGSVTAITAGIAVTIFTAGLGTGAGVAIASVGAGALTTTAGMWAVENKWIGGKDMAVDFALNAIPFGMGKAFSYMRSGAQVALNASKAWVQTLAMGGMYAAEGAVDVGIMSGGQSVKTGESFTDSLEDNVAWAIFPLLLHKGAPALKGIKSTLLDPLFARKNLAEETMNEINKAKILAQLGKKQMSQEILDKLNTKLKNLKRNETMKLLDEEAELVVKKDALANDIATYIAENRVGKKAQLSITRVSPSGKIDNFNAIGDKLIVVNSQGVRKEVTLIKYDGANSRVSLDGGSAMRADLTGGSLNIKSPIFKGETITGSYMSKHPNTRGVNINTTMAEFEQVKTDLVGVRSLTNTTATFSREMNDLSVIYLQLRRDIRNLSAGDVIDDFLGYKVTKTAKGFEVTDKSGVVTKMNNSSEVLRLVLPAAEAQSERLLAYKLAHLYDNMTPERIEKILGKIGKKAKGKKNVYEIAIQGDIYQVHFDPTRAEKIFFKDAAGKILTPTDPLVRQLETKVFVRISQKYKAFAMQCKDVKTPLGRLIPDRLKPKMLQALADKLHKPITFVEKYTVGEVIEAFEKFADAPSFKNFIMAAAGGGGLNTMLLTGVVMMDVGNNKFDEVGTDYIKYVLGGTLAPLVDMAGAALEKKVDEHKGNQTKGEDFSTDT